MAAAGSPVCPRRRLDAPGVSCRASGVNETLNPSSQLHNPDRCTHLICGLPGVQHSDYEPGYEPPSPENASPTLSRNSSVNSRHASSFRTSIFDGYICHSRHQNALILPNDIHDAPAHIVRQKSTQILRHTSGPHIALISTIFETLRPTPSNLSRPMLLQPTSQRLSPLVLPQNVDGPVARRRDGLVTLFGGPYIAIGSIVTCDSTLSARYVVFSFLSTYILTSP